MKLVFASLIRCSQRWSRVSITDIERHQAALGANRVKDRSAAEDGSEGGTLEEKEDRVTQAAAFSGRSGLDPSQLRVLGTLVSSVSADRWSRLGFVGEFVGGRSAWLALAPRSSRGSLRPCAPASGPCRMGPCARGYAGHRLLGRREGSRRVPPTRRR